MKRFTVGELKAELEKYDDNLPIVAYDGFAEEGGFVSEVHLEVDKRCYFKDDHPFSYSDVDKAVFICGNFDGNAYDEEYDADDDYDEV